MKTYELSEEVKQAIITYLCQKPYREVADCIAYLTALPEIKKEELAEQ